MKLRNLIKKFERASRCQVLYQNDHAEFDSADEEEYDALAKELSKQLTEIKKQVTLLQEITTTDGFICEAESDQKYGKAILRLGELV